ncbi:MAG: MFS transporter, partial [Solirubrobacteraceae bacterium]
RLVLRRHRARAARLRGVAGACAVCGALVGLRWRPARPLRAGLLLVLAWPFQAAALALGAPLALVVGCALATGFGFSLVTIWWETALARHIPPHALSRVSAYDWMGSLALLPLGFVLAGPLAGALGARTVLIAGSAIGLVLLLLALIPRSTRELRDGDGGGGAGGAFGDPFGSGHPRDAPQPSSSRAMSA